MQSNRETPGVSAEDKPPPRTHESGKLYEIQNRIFTAPEPEQEWTSAAGPSPETNANKQTSLTEATCGARLTANTAGGRRRRSLPKKIHDLRLNYSSFNLRRSRLHFWPLSLRLTGTGNGSGGKLAAILGDLKASLKKGTSW